MMKPNNPLLVKTSAESAEDEDMMKRSFMKTVYVEKLFRDAYKGVDNWLKELKGRLSGDDEVRICEATRMLVAYVRHLRMTSSVMSEKSPETVNERDCLAKFKEAESLVGDAKKHVKDPARQARIQRRLVLLQELPSL